MRSNLQERLDGLAREWSISGTVCVTKDGHVVAHGAYGWADRENGVRFGENTTCYIASVTKQFTAACAMMLYEQGILDIDDKLDRYIPEYSHASEITLRQLLNMRSGIQHELDVIYDRVTAQKDTLGLSDRDFEIYRTMQCAPENCTFADFLALVNDLPLRFRPGERYEYSDTNYMLLGEIVGRMSNSTIGDYMTEHIFRPLGMSHTVFGADLSQATSYDTFDGERVLLGRAHFITGEGAICTTAQDISIWMNAVLNGRFLEESSWAQCFDLVDGKYGFGWSGADGWYSHGGGDLGFRSEVFIRFEDHVTIAVIGNEALPKRDEAQDETFGRSVRRLVAEKYGIQF